MGYPQLFDALVRLRRIHKLACPSTRMQPTNHILVQMEIEDGDNPYIVAVYIVHMGANPRRSIYRSL
jgi:hypothetical protein